MFTQFDSACLAAFLLTKKTGLRLDELLSLLLALDVPISSRSEIQNSLMTLFKKGLLAMSESGPGATSFARTLRDQLILHSNKLEFKNALNESLNEFFGDADESTHEESSDFQTNLEQDWLTEIAFQKAMEIANSNAT